MVSNPPRTVDLDHRAYYLQGAPQQSLCVAADVEGSLTLVDIDTGRKASIAGLPEIRDVHPHPSRRLLVLVDDETGRLCVLDFDGSRIFERKAPRCTKRLPRGMRSGFEAAFFDQEGSHLWSASRLSAETLAVQLWETERWSVVGSATVDDPFEEAECSFHATGRPDVVALWLTAGQNGQVLSWMTRHPDSLGAEPEPYLDDALPPVFAPSGHEFLVIDEDWRICKYPFPADRKLGTCRSRWGEGDSFGSGLCYLDDSTALVHTHHGRLFRVDLRAMKLRAELVIRGHEPKPVPFYYPGLDDDGTLCTDISHFTRIGETLVLAHSREDGTDTEKRPDTLTLDDVQYALEKTASGGRR
jgi:hypothetical protein